MPFEKRVNQEFAMLFSVPGTLGVGGSPHFAIGMTMPDGFLGASRPVRARKRFEAKGRRAGPGIVAP